MARQGRNGTPARAYARGGQRTASARGRSTARQGRGGRDGRRRRPSSSRSGSFAPSRGFSGLGLGGRGGSQTGGSDWFGLLSGPRDVVVPRLVLLMSVFVLTVFGLVMVFSSSSVLALDNGLSVTSYLQRQVVALVVALVLGGIMAAIPYTKWQGRLLDALCLASIVLLLLTAVMGTSALGAKRWLYIGPINFQPSELTKVAVVIMAARILYDMHTLELSVGDLVLRIVVGIVVPLVLVLKMQSDLGTTLICCVGMLAVCVLDGMSWRTIAIVVGGLLALAVVSVAFSGYRADRVASMFSGGDSDTAYQTQMSLQAFANGGLFGVGVGNSSMKYGTLPEAHTDFIFAIVGEELGLVGSLFVVALFLVLGWAGMKIARNAPDTFGTMVAGGCTTMLVAQAFMNILCVVGLLPVTGKPLPFMSSGGSALIGSFLIVGTVLSVSLQSGDDSSVYRRRRDSLRVVRRDS